MISGPRVIILRQRNGLRGIFFATALLIAIVLEPAAGIAQQPQPPGQRMDLRPLVAGLGAIAGVVIFNWAALGIEALPGGIGYGATATVPAEMSVAMSRVYATASAVAGGLIAYYGYRP